MGRSLLLKTRQPSQSRLVARRHAGIVCGPLLVKGDLCDQPLTVLIPPSLQLIESLETGFPYIVVVGETPHVRPDRITDRAGLHREESGRHLVEKFTIVTDKKDRFSATDHLLLQPNFASDVEIVVGFVQQQDLCV